MSDGGPMGSYGAATFLRPSDTAAVLTSQHNALRVHGDSGVNEPLALTVI